MDFQPIASGLPTSEKKQRRFKEVLSLMTSQFLATFAGEKKAAFMLYAFLYVCYIDNV